MFSSEHVSKSDKEVNEMHHAADNANTTEVANSGTENSMAETSDMDLDVRGGEC